MSFLHNREWKLNRKYLVTLSCLLQRNTFVMKLIQYQYELSAKQNIILSKHLNCWRTKVLRHTFIEKDCVNIKVRHALRSSSPPP